MHKIVLLRHGESVWNKENRFAGWADVELTEKGIEQARKAGIVLKEQGFVFDAAFTSVLKRAVQTTRLVLQEMGLGNIAIEQSWRLNERHYGALQGVNRKEAVKEFGTEQVQIWRRSYNVRPPAAVEQKENEPACESLEDVFSRVVPYWQEKISPAIRQGKNVLISAHGNSLRALVKMLDEISDEEIEKLNIPVCIPLVYELSGGLRPQQHYYLFDESEVKKAIEAVEKESIL
ncbi:MAG: 2,3-bisphosphoglycerate-dependent phosphoglycerate mutase [Patescibacteria group bacterium]|nr:2,3-bisphosphoglycerate-dependent phosphoglycerate mutase [Patescibacteria group bacterium]